MGATGPASPPASQPASQPAKLEPVPLLTAEEEARTFNLPAGYRAEVVATEPTVQHPVAMAFDERGRLWVAEMRNYMPDVYGTRETKPGGRISVLTDTDGDGRMDRATVFLDGLVLPRAIGFGGGGVLVGTPPNLLFCRDTNGDDICDEKRIIATNYGVPENPENFANGLLYNIDNWIYNADHLQRYRAVAGRVGEFEVGWNPNLGQWGITHDDVGRLFYNTNSDYLRGTLVPPHYASRNAASPVSIADTRIATDQTVFPAHRSTENRGYRPGILKEDGRLAEFTAACSPHVYRADLMPEFYGNVFVCEASANLVRRAVISEKDLKLSAENAYRGKEFIASTYERFRPVSIQTGPDGALYIVDMHHGIIQHKMSLTPYARDQYREKQLHKHLGTGRIFRIVPEGKVAKARPRLDQLSDEELVRQLTHPNGWWRDKSQQILVERRDLRVAGLLAEMVKRGEKPVYRLHALWTLEGMGALSREVVDAALADENAKVRAAGIRVSENFLKDPAWHDAVMKLERDPDWDVRVQFALTMSAMTGEAAEKATARVLLEHGEQHMIREAVVSGIAHHEIKLLARLLNDPGWVTRSEARHDCLTDIARSVTRRQERDEMVGLVELMASVPKERSWQQLAMLEAVPEVRKDAFGFARPLELNARPSSLDQLASASSAEVRKCVEKVEALFTWPGKPMPPRPPVKPLTDQQKQLFELGRVTFEKTCAQCHKADGMGQEGKAPPLVGSPWVQGPENRLIRIVLHGARGPFNVNGRVWNMDMPGWQSALDDRTIAGILTFIRRSWGHEAAPVDPAKVQSVRDWGQARRDGWTEKELLEVK